MRLGNVISVNPESIRKDYPFDEIEYVDISSVDTGSFSGSTLMPLAEAPSRAKRLVKHGDTILATVRPNLRSFLFIKNPPDNMVVSTGFVVLHPGYKMDARFLYYAVTDQKFTDYLTANAKGSAYPAVDTETIARAEIYFPTLAIQRKIAAILSAYDDLIENNLRRIKILEEMAQKLYREWFVNFRFPGHEKVRMVDSPLGKIPEGWKVKKLGDIADISWGDTSITKASYVEEGYAAYSASGLDGQMDHYDYDRKGIVLSAIGAKCGKTWLARGKWSCIKNTIRFWAKDDCVSTEFLFIATEGEGFWPRRGAAQPFISQGDAERIELLIPDHVTMKSFNTFVTIALEQITILQAQIKILRQTRDLLLPKLISGEVDVSELDIKNIEESEK